MSTKTGLIVDVSRYQGTIDWEKAKNAGVTHAFLKTVSTNSNFGGIYIDPTFEDNYAECKRLGINVGVYYYTYAQTQQYADAELNKLREAITGKSFEMPIVVDVEDNSLKQLTSASLTDLIIYALDKIQTWGGYAMWYTYTSYKNTELEVDRLAAYDCWIADYTGKTLSGTNWSLHQYTSKGKVDGIAGNVDLSKYNPNNSIDHVEVIKKKGLNDFTDTIPTATYISANPVQLDIGPAETEDDLKKIVKVIESIGGIECSEKDGHVITTVVSMGDQKTIVGVCNKLYVPCTEYIAIEEKPESSEVEDLKAQVVKLTSQIEEYTNTIMDLNSTIELYKTKISEQKTAFETISGVCNRMI